MKLENLRSLIRESVHDYIREIDEAAKVGAIKASIAKCEEAIGIRERKMNMEGLDEAYHDMLDKGKMAELKSEVKALTKSLEKYKKQLAKLEKVDEVKDDVVTDSEVEEVATDETMTEEAPIDETDVMAEMDLEKEIAINESFLKMQKLAGVITESEYNQKKSLVENQLNEDYLELKSIGKQLYSFLKKKGYTVKIIENSSKSPYRGGTTLTTGTNAGRLENDGPPVEIHQLSDVEQIAVAVPVYALSRVFILDDANRSFLEQTITKKGEKTGALNDPKQYWSSISDQVFGAPGKIASPDDIKKNPQIQKYIANLGKELTGIVKSKKPNAMLSFKDTDIAYVMYFADAKTAKGGTIN